MEEFGEPILTRALEANALIRTEMPDPLRILWQDYGASLWQNGSFQLLDPAKYGYVLELWRQSLPIEESQILVPFYMDCFGSVKVWQLGVGASFSYLPDFHALYLDDRFNSRGQSKRNQDIAMEGKIIFDPLEEGPETELFQSAKESLGDLGLDQIYALKQARPLGGTRELENLQIASAPEYLAMVAELEPPRVMTTDDLARIAFGAAGPEALRVAAKDIR